jgi:hypothetical protein
MAHPAASADVTTRPSGAAAAEPKPDRSPPSLAGRFLMWIAIMVAGIAALGPLANLVTREMDTWSLVFADDAAIKAELVREWPAEMSAARLETLAELALDLNPPDTAAAIKAAGRAVEADPSRAGAWAQLAYLEFSRTNSVNAAALEALARSMDACPLCSEQLVRWRFNFVLANWSAIPEALRRRAFEHADRLRWIGVNAEFLAEMRMKATLAGIPFDRYRSEVDTPVRSWDLAPLQATTEAREAGG